MKKIILQVILLVGAVGLFGLTTGCEEEHEHGYHGGAYDDYYHGYGYGSDRNPYYYDHRFDVPNNSAYPYHY